MVPHTEGDVRVVQVKQTTVLDGLSVPCQIGEDRPSRAGLLAVNNPFLRAEGFKFARKHPGIIECKKLSKKSQLTTLESCNQTVEENVTEAAGQHTMRQERRFARSPASAIVGDSSARDETVQVWVVLQIAAPGVKNGRDSNLGAEPLAIGGQRQKRLGCRLEQQVVYLALVLVGHRLDGAWKREHDVEILDWQQFRLTRSQPSRGPRALALGTAAIAARVERDPCVCAILAALDVATEGCRATCFDCVHDALLLTAYMTRIGRAPGFAMTAKHIGDLQPWMRHLILRARPPRKQMY